MACNGVLTPPTKIISTIKDPLSPQRYGINEFRFSGLSLASFLHLICLPETGCLKPLLKHVALSEWYLSATCLLFLDSLKWIDLYSFFDCEKPSTGLDPSKIGFCNSAQFPKFFCPQSVSSNSLKTILICLPIFTFGSVSDETNPSTTECIFPCGIKYGSMLEKSSFL